MSEAKHTPGPWQRHGSHIYTADPERAILAQVFNPGKRPEDYPLTENANLMSAAPELLDVAEHFCCHRNMDILDGTCVFRCGRIKNGVLVEAIIIAIILYCRQPYQYTCECEKCDDWFTVVTSKELNEKQREYIRNFCVCK